METALLRLLLTRILLVVLFTSTVTTGQRLHKCDDKCKSRNMCLSATTALVSTSISHSHSDATGKAGNFRFEGCSTTAECPGGLCTFKSCVSPSCDGTSCHADGS